MPMPASAFTISLSTAKNCFSMPTSISTRGTTGRKSLCVRKNSFLPGILPTPIATIPIALAPLTPGRSRRSFLNSASSASSCSSVTTSSFGLLSDINQLLFRICGNQAESTQDKTKFGDGGLSRRKHRFGVRIVGGGQADNREQEGLGHDGVGQALPAPGVVG